MLAALALAATLVVAHGPAPTRVGLTVSPSHVTLAAGATTAVHVSGSTRQRLVLHARLTGIELDARGRPRAAPFRGEAPLLAIHPRAAALGANGTTFTLVAGRGPGPPAGDHCAIVLITATPAGRSAVAVALRIGLVATVRVPGTRVRRLRVLAARGLPRAGGLRRIAVTIANRGNVVETVGGTTLGISLLRGGRVVAQLRVGRRALLPRTRAVVMVRWRSTLRGAVVARIRLRQPGGAGVVRAFPLRL